MRRRDGCLKKKRSRDLTHDNINKEYLNHDIKQLRKILGPNSKDLDFFEEALQWPHKPQATLDAEWELLCSEYAKLTGSSKNHDGVEVPSMSDLCYYIGDWALKYADMGTNIPTSNGEPPTSHPYWARNQVLLFADNGKICPRLFKQELEDELFSLIHYANKETEEENIFNALMKVEEVVRWFFFAGDEWLPMMMDYVVEEYEKRLRRGLMQEQPTPFCDLLYEIIRGKNVARIPLQELLILMKDFVNQCEKIKHRDFSWAPHTSTFYNKLPVVSPPVHKNDNHQQINKNGGSHISKKKRYLYAVFFILGICMVLFAATYRHYVLQ